MRFGLVVSWLLVTASVLTSSLLVTPASGQDFEPGGRRRRPPGGQGGQGRPRAGEVGPSARVKKPPTAEKHKANAEELIARYTKALLAQPTSAFPLQKLAELYRHRDGNLDKLISDFEHRAAAATAGSDLTSARLALAGVYLTARRRADAKKLLDSVVLVRTKDAAPRLMRAALAEQDGEKEQAKRHYESALPLVTEPSERERVLRQLMILCIELKQFDDAKKHHNLLVKASGASIYVKKELGTELMARDHHGRAEAEFRALVKEAEGDNRALAPALRDLGQALAKQKELDEALTVLKRARQVAGHEAGIRNEILAILTEVYREQNKLAELIGILESEGGRDFARLALIGALYEETGAVEKAISAFRAALLVNGKDVDVRIKLVHLLQSAGQLDVAIAEFEALIKAAPSNTELLYELADTLIQRGERDRALALVTDLERRSGNDPDVLAAIADFYERIEEPARALKVFERLAATADGDPEHLIDLGDRYFQNGDRARAVATWKRLLTGGAERADRLARLGEVYLEHDMQDEALATLREAAKSKPNDARVKKQLAGALEKSGSVSGVSQFRYREALVIWHELLANAADDVNLARESRSHIVSLWAILHELEGRVAALAERLGRTPPDLDAGRLLAEVQRRLNKPADAESTLRRIVQLAPGDEASLLALERVLVIQKNLAGAIDTLALLVEVSPKRAREYYQRMAQYAAELYRDDAAIGYAAKALELSPGDAEGHYRLAEMYKRRQDNDKAMVELRKALAKNPRLFKAHFELAELALATGELDEADRLYRAVIRTSRDEEHIVRAARLAMQLHLGRGTLASLERELLPVALGNPQKPVYRRLLVELYGVMTSPLVYAARIGTADVSAAARRELAAIGARAVKPLLDALADTTAVQQRTAIDVLAYVQNKGAGPALFNFATGQEDPELRVRAMIACGALEDPALLSRYDELLGVGDGTRVEGGAGDGVTLAAVWGLARMREKKAGPLLRRLLESPTPDVRALAAIGLALIKVRANAPALAVLVRSPDTSESVRAAAAIALGELGDRSHRAALLALTESGNAAVHGAALVAIARLDVEAKVADAASGAGRNPAIAADPAIAAGRDPAIAAGRDPAIAADLAAAIGRALTSEYPGLRRAAVATAALLLVREPSRSHTLTVPDARISIAQVIADFVPSGYSRESAARAILGLRGSLPQVAAQAVMVSADRMGTVAEFITTRLAGVLDGTGVVSPATTAELGQLAEAIATASVPGFLALATHPDRAVKMRAVELLARRNEPEARRAVVRALDPSDAELCLAVLASLEDLSDRATHDAIVGLLRHATSWSVRSRAATMLGRASVEPRGADDDARMKSARTGALAHAARKDTFAIVREAALVALSARDRLAAAPTLRDALANDDEPRVRQVAGQLLDAASVAIEMRGQPDGAAASP
ncbi:MAG: tetratricopeptide repeat protein [Myxococcales bacterium]|nr:tetratricopeptide repeat protein [Myxococcales bacterium]